ncbi:MAG: DoxX family protein [Gemmatimonadales bacterium]
MRRLFPMDPDLALLLLRITLAAILLYHGIPKALNYSATLESFNSMGIPAPALTLAFAVIVEVVGGVLILLGVLTEITGLLVAIEMLGAIVTVHWANGFDFTKVGWEHPFTVLMIALALVLAGPGAYSVGGRRTP